MNLKNLIEKLDSSSVLTREQIKNFSAGQYDSLEECLALCQGHSHGGFPGSPGWGSTCINEGINVWSCRDS